MTPLRASLAMMGIRMKVTVRDALSALRLTLSCCHKPREIVQGRPISIKMRSNCEKPPQWLGNFRRIARALWKGHINVCAAAVQHPRVDPVTFYLHVFQIGVDRKTSSTEDRSHKGAPSLDDS